MLARLSCILLLTVVVAARAEEPKAPAPPAPAPAQPPKPAPATAPAAGDNLQPYLADLQSSDAAKEEAAIKALVDSGIRGYMALTALTRSTTPEIAKRAADVRKQIEGRATQRMTEITDARGKLEKMPLTPQALEDIRQQWLALAEYAPQQNVRQNCAAQANELQQESANLGKMADELQKQDQLLAATPAPQGVIRATIQFQRADLLRNLQRDPEALTAAKDCVAAGGKAGHHSAEALQLMAEVSARQNDDDGAEAACKTILRDYPRALEAKFAYKTLSDQYSTQKRWEDAVKITQDFIAAAPLDDDAEDALDNLLSALLNAHDYARSYALASWTMAQLPIQRWKEDTPEDAGRLEEYVRHDYKKALADYRVIAEQYPGDVDPVKLQAALDRVQAKIDGKFPKEPVETDAGPAGAFARFLKAVRTHDEKLLDASATDADARQFKDKYADADDETLPALVFGDFIVTKVETNEKTDNTTLRVDYYDAASNTPLAAKEFAEKVDGTWRIDWQPLPTKDAQAAVPAPEQK